MAITNGSKVICNFCSLPFEPKKSWQLYCSYVCGYNGQNAKKKRGITNLGHCARCGKELSHKKAHAIYCSRTCKSIDHTFKKRGKTRFTTTARRRVIFERDLATCYICKKSVDFTDFHLDHLIPVAKGGSSEPKNLAVACPQCNRRRGVRIGIEQFKKILELEESNDY